MSPWRNGRRRPPVPGGGLADDTATSSQTASATGSTNAVSGEQGPRLERLKEALPQLDLTDAQKAQIKQIRASVTDRKERRQEIMAVLTPDQKAKLVAMWQARKNEAGAGTETTSGTGEN